MSKKDITSASEYRKGKRHVVELPSGATFEIRKLSPLAFGELLNFIEVREGATEEETTARVRSEIVNIMKTIIPQCIVNPTIAFEPDMTEEEMDEKNVIDFADLDLNDVFVLLDAVYEFSGLTEEAAQERTKFRKRTTRKKRSKTSS